VFKISSFVAISSAKKIDQSGWQWYANAVLDNLGKGGKHG
jgi:hypothetical protein